MATNEFEHVHFAWQARCFVTLQKLFVTFSLAGVRSFAFFDVLEVPFFSCFRREGGSGGGCGVGGVIINVLYMPFNDTTFLIF